MTISFSHTDSNGMVHHGNGSSTPPLTGGQRLAVYRAAGQDATNGGISSTHDDLTLVGWVDRTKSTQGRNHVLDLPEKVRGPWGINCEAATDAPAPAVVLVVTDGVFGRALSLLPAAWTWKGWKVADGAMFGGNYAAGDSRFPELIELVAGIAPHGPVKIHDRIEG